MKKLVLCASLLFLMTGCGTFKETKGMVIDKFAQNDEYCVRVNFLKVNGSHGVGNYCSKSIATFNYFNLEDKVTVEYNWSGIDGISK